MNDSNRHPIPRHLHEAQRPAFDSIMLVSKRDGSIVLARMTVKFLSLARQVVEWQRKGTGTPTQSLVVTPTT